MASELFLWDHPLSPFGQKVRIALREKKIPFKAELPKGAASGDPSIIDPKFAEANLRLELPTLVDGDVQIFDSTIILEYIEDKYTDIPLRPADPAARAKARMIEDICDSQYEAINWGMGEVDLFKRAEGEKAAELRQQAKHQVEQLQAWLTKQLGNSKWFGGDQFGWADVCVWPMVNRSRTYNLEPSPGTPLRDWYERAKERESVMSVFEEFEAGVKERAANVGTMKKVLLRREYRDHRLEWMIKSGGIDIVMEGIKKDNIRFSWPDPLK